MTLSKKYHEVMEKIEVTDEMRTRILQNVQAQSMQGQTGEEPARKTSYSFRRYAPIAACLLVVISLAIVLPKVWQPIEGNPGGMTQVGNPMNEYSSLQELEAAVGFEVNEIPTLPFEVTQELYVAYDDGIAELQYIGADMDITYRKAVGTADISGDYSEYDREEMISVNDAEVLLKGDTDYDSLAIWTQGEYSYALRLNPGADRETVRKLLQAIIDAPVS